MSLFASCCCACFELRSQIIVYVGLYAADLHLLCQETLGARKGEIDISSSSMLLEGFYSMGTNGDQCFGQWMPNESIGVQNYPY